MVTAMFLKVENVSKIHTDAKRGKGFVALKGIDLEIEKNEFVCIIGPSGCGKTTLLHIIAGFEKPSHGRVLLSDTEVKKPSPDRAVVFQESSLYPWMSILENIKFGLDLAGHTKEEQESLARGYLSLVGLEAFEDARPHELSGGMKQKVAIARTLALDPELLLMDEPFAALDEQTRQKMDDELLNIWENDVKTVIFVTHNIEEAIMLADRIVILATSPGEIYDEVKVDIPRPRNLFSNEVVELRKRLLADMQRCHRIE